MTIDILTDTMLLMFLIIGILTGAGAFLYLVAFVLSSVKNWLFGKKEVDVTEKEPVKKMILANGEVIILEPGIIAHIDGKFMRFDGDKWEEA